MLHMWFYKQALAAMLRVWFPKRALLICCMCDIPRGPSLTCCICGFINRPLLTCCMSGFMRWPHRHIGEDFGLVHMVAHMHDIVGLQADPNHMEAHGQQAPAVGAVVAHSHI
jgi:hypothetical protein